MSVAPELLVVAPELSPAPEFLVFMIVASALKISFFMTQAPAPAFVFTH